MAAIGPGGVSSRSPQTRVALDYRYDEAERGPCKVVIERSANSDLADKNLNRFKYAKRFNVTYKNSIVDVNSSGFGKLAVITKSAREANVILNDRSLEGMGLRATIPSYFVSSQGVISGIPLDMTEQEIRDNLVTLGGSQRAISLLDFRRLDRKNINKDTNKVEYVPSRSVLLTFKGRTLPQKVSIYNAATNVQPYTPPVKICWNCLRYGHISKQCRSKARCKRCGDLVHNDSPCPCTNGAPKCVHCKGPHLPNSRDCPEYKFQNDFRTYATTHCLTFAEAKKILRPKKSGTQSHNSTPAPSIFNFNFSSYPDLGDTPAPSSNVPYFPQTSYSEVARSVPTPNCSGSSSTTARLFSKTRDPQNKQGPESIKRRRNSTPITNPFSSSLYNNRIQSTLPNGCALLPFSTAYYHPLFEFPYNYHIFSPQINMEIGFLVQNSSDPPTLFKELTEAQFRDFLFFYTDGSKSQDGKTAGCASVCPSAQLRHSWKLNSAASIFSMEAIAVLYTLDHIKEQKFKNSIIFTDSLSVLQSISFPNPNNIKSCLIFVIRNRLAILSSQNCNVILAWIPGHVSVPGKELADAAAKSASMNAPFLNIELPHSDFSRCFREHLDKRCQDYCSTRGKHFGAYYTERFFKPSRKPWFANFNARSEWIVSLCRMRSNHHSLRESLHRKNIVDSPGCPCDPQIKEDLEHVLWECPRFDHFRPGLLKGLSKALKCKPPVSK